MLFRKRSRRRPSRNARQFTLGGESLETRKMLTATTEVMHLAGTTTDVPASTAELTRDDDGVSVACGRR